MFASYKPITLLNINDLKNYILLINHIWQRSYYNIQWKQQRIERKRS